MSLLLYYSISSGLTKDEIIEIDRYVAKNQETVCIFVRNLKPNVRNLNPNVKDKTKRVILIITLVSVVWFGNLQSVNAIGLPMPPASVVRVQRSYHHDFKVQIAKVIPRKKDLIVYKSPKEILFLMYLTDPRLSSNREVLKLVKELRGGDWGVVGTTAVVVLIILIYSMGDGFVPVNQNPGWGLDRSNPFQPPEAEHRYPPAYDLFFPRRTPGGLSKGAGLRSLTVTKNAESEKKNPSFDSWDYSNIMNELTKQSKAKQSKAKQSKAKQKSLLYKLLMKYIS